MNAHHETSLSTRHRNHRKRRNRFETRWSKQKKREQCSSSGGSSSISCVQLLLPILWITCCSISIFALNKAVLTDLFWHIYLNRLQTNFSVPLPSNSSSEDSSSRKSDNPRNIRNYFAKRIQTKKESLFSLDDYYVRPHFSANDDSSRDEKPILIVGGTDGSGTRAFVSLLRNRLGVQMLVEDEINMDIHAERVFRKRGWPYVVNMVFRSMHSANYNATDLPPSIYQKAMNEIYKFKVYYDYQAKQPAINKYFAQLKQLLLFGKLSRKSVSPFTAKEINYGFKAPISMTLLPLFRNIYGNIKYIHVVRDGRDVAVSSNMSPVGKFYDEFYDENVAKERRLNASQIIESSECQAITEQNLLAMDLWNDMNAQVLEYLHENEDGGKTLDYVVVRTEDLLGSSEQRLAVITKLADFVGSTIPLSGLCRMSEAKTIRDQGKSNQLFQSDDFQPENEDVHDDVRERYGKWRARLQDEPFSIYEALHQRGNKLLEALGYEPAISTQADISQTSKMHIKCLEHFNSLKENTPVMMLARRRYLKG